MAEGIIFESCAVNQTLNTNISGASWLTRRWTIRITARWCVRRPTRSAGSGTPASSTSFLQVYLKLDLKLTNCSIYEVNCASCDDRVRRKIWSSLFLHGHASFKIIKNIPIPDLKEEIVFPATAKSIPYFLPNFQCSMLNAIKKAWPPRLQRKTASRRIFHDRQSNYM